MIKEKVHASVDTDNIIFNYYKTKSANENPSRIYHTHKYFELILFLDGDFTYNTENSSIKLKKNDLILTPPNVLHCLKNTSPTIYERYNITFFPSDFGELNVMELCKNLDVINVGHNEIILNIFKKLDYYCSHLTINDFISVSHCLLKELFINLKLVKLGLPETSNELTELLQNAISHINNNLFTIDNVNEISEKLFVSSAYLYRIFKKELGITPRKYINEKRLLAAQNMLLLGKKPTDVYLYCGFNEYTSFYRNYVEYFGYPPSEETVKIDKD